MRKLALIPLAFAVAIVPAAFSSQAQAASSYQVSLTTDTTHVAQGNQLALYGTVSPAAKGSTLKIQWFDRDQGGDRWRTLLTTTVKSGGKYAQYFTPRDGATDYRVYKPSGSGLAGGASRTVTLRAYAWYKLANEPELPVIYGANLKGQYGPQTVAGVPVTRYWSTGQTANGRTQWGTLRSCTHLRASVGLDDRSAEGADAQFRVAAGSKRIVSERVTKGTMTEVLARIPRADTSRLTFSAEPRNALVPTYVNASKPQAYCAFPEDD